MAALILVPAGTGTAHHLQFGLLLYLYNGLNAEICHGCFFYNIVMQQIIQYIFKNYFDLEKYIDIYKRTLFWDGVP